MTVEQLLFALLVQSGNDAAEILAENFPGGRPAFIDAMNTKAAELNLIPHFTNPTGIDEPGHYSSAADLARLATVAMENPEFAASSPPKIPSFPNHVLTNINELLGKVPGVLGVKTGFTDGAGQSLVTLINRDDHPVIMVVLGSMDRFGDSEKLINWVLQQLSLGIIFGLPPAHTPQILHHLQKHIPAAEIPAVAPIRNTPD